MESALRAQVNREYEMWFNHIRSIRDAKRDVIEKLLPEYVEWQPLKMTLLWKNLQLENSLFLNDDLDVQFTWEDWVISREVMANANLAASFDNEELGLYYVREKIVNDCALYGLSATVIDGFDDEEIAPIVDSISPLSIIPDPKCWQDSKMRFIWFERRLSADSVRNSPLYDVKDVSQLVTYSQELDKDERARNSASWATDVVDNEWMVDIYDHFLVYDGKKWLTTWIDSRQTLIRCVEIEPLTKAELLKPTKVTFPIQLHRRKPKPWSFIGVSIADEVLQFQDNISILSNLQLIQARQAALWPDKFIDQNLGVDVAKLAEKKPGGRYIPVRTQTGNVWASIFTEQPTNPSQFPFQIKNELNSFMEWTTGVSSIAFGQSISGSQTKAEIQTLQQNTNQILGWIGSNYLRGQKEFWKAWYKSYSLNMWSKDKKNIALFQEWKALSRQLSKKDFISEGKIQVFVVSKQNEDAQNQKDVARLLSVANLYIANMKQGSYGFNEFLRKIGDKLWVKWFDSHLYIEETPDEIDAKSKLGLLNKDVYDEEAFTPQPWQDLRTYIAIYKQALDTPAKFRAVRDYTLKLEETKDIGMQPQWQSDSTTWAMAMNMVNSELQNQVPSTQQVAF